MSDNLVHLTKERSTAATILRTLRLRAINPYGAVRKLPQLAESQRVACLSEIPLAHLPRLVERHGRYGVGFRKSFVQAAGGNPVWYLHKNSPAQLALFEEIRRTAYISPPEPGSWLWRITPFIDYPGAYGSVHYEYDWEREWRHVGDLAFHPEDVAFLFAPAEEHDLVRDWWGGQFGSTSPPCLDAELPTDQFAVEASRHAL